MRACRGPSGLSSDFTPTNFPALTLQEFPHLREEFAEHEGLPYVKMGAFATHPVKHTLAQAAGGLIGALGAPT